MTITTGYTKNLTDPILSEATRSSGGELLKGDESVLKTRLLVVITLVGIFLGMGPTTTQALPKQATWTVTSSGCPWGQQVKIMAMRSPLSQNPANYIMCNLTGNRDSNLRSAGTDNFHDGYKVGNYSWSNANTTVMGNYMGFTIYAYNGTCYSGSRFTITSGNAINVLNGLMSMRGTNSEGC